MRQSHLKIRYHNRGLSLKKDCVMNMTVLHHEYTGYAGWAITVLIPVKFDSAHGKT